jgi:hypothetical protein
LQPSSVTAPYPFAADFDLCASLIFLISRPPFPLVVLWATLNHEPPPFFVRRCSAVLLNARAT